MKNIKKISYSDIKKILISNNIYPISNLKDNECFTSLSSISNADANELTFFNDASQLMKLKNIKAKACLINNIHLKNLPS